MRIAGRQVSKPSGSEATRRFVSAMPCAGWEEPSGVPAGAGPGAEGKVRIMEVISSAPVAW